MGTNSSKWDNEAHLNAKTTSELEKLRDYWVSVLASGRVHTVANDQLAIIRMKIAERIGKPKT